MTDPIIGRKGGVYLGTNIVANLANIKLDFPTDELDGSAFSDSSWGSTLPGQQKWVATVDGFLDMGDTNGQALIKAAKFNGTKITNMRFFHSRGGSYWCSDITTDAAAGCYVSTMSIDQPYNGLVKVNYKIGGAGPIIWV
jgi:hypothetical protein